MNPATIDNELRRAVLKAKQAYVLASKFSPDPDGILRPLKDALRLLYKAMRESSLQRGGFPMVYGQLNTAAGNAGYSIQKVDDLKFYKHNPPKYREALKRLMKGLRYLIRSITRARMEFRRKKAIDLAVVRGLKKEPRLLG